MKSKYETGKEYLRRVEKFEDKMLASDWARGKHNVSIKFNYREFREIECYYDFVVNGFTGYFTGVEDLRIYIKVRNNLSSVKTLYSLECEVAEKYKYIITGEYVDDTIVFDFEDYITNRIANKIKEKKEKYNKNWLNILLKRKYGSPYDPYGTCYHWDYKKIKHTAYCECLEMLVFFTNKITDKNYLK